MTQWPDLRSAKAWQALLIALTLLTAVQYLAGAFATHFTIQDDARQFLGWMARLRDPAAMPGDLIADYFQSVSPRLFRLIYALPAAVGIDPLITSKLLVPALLIASAIAAWRVASAIAPRPAAAFIAATLTMLVVVHDDSIFSATPRAFLAPLFLRFLDGLIRDRRMQAIISLALLAAIYPAPALVALTTLGLSCIRWRPSPDRRLMPGSIPFITAAVIAVGLAILPFRIDTHRWSPNVTLAEASTMPTFASHEGRTNLVEADGQIGWVCSDRVGFMPRIVNCHGSWSRGALIDFALAILPILVLTGRALRRLSRGETVGPDGLIFAQVFVAAALWWTIAALTAFNLHLPGRYSQRVLALVGVLALGKLLGEVLADPIERRPALGIGLVLLLLIGFATPKMKLVTPDDDIAIARIAALPSTTRIAGISDTLDFVPALTGRSVLATAEAAIPYQLGYFRPLSQRMADTVAALATPDRAAFGAFVHAYRIDVMLVDRALLAGQALAPRYATLIPAAPAPRPDSWTAIHAPGCTLYKGPRLLLLDAHCLANAA